jgi:hypothetical protein
MSLNFMLNTYIFTCFMFFCTTMLVGSQILLWILKISEHQVLII